MAMEISDDDIIEFTIEVENDGDVVLSDIEVSDDGLKDNNGNSFLLLMGQPLSQVVKVLKSLPC